MAQKRSLAVVALVLGVAAVAALLWWADPAGMRSGGRDGTHERDSSREIAGGAGGAAAGSDAADRERIAGLIARYGGFTSRGRMVLTRPDAPAAGLLVTISCELDGDPVSMQAKTDATGAFSFAPLPRAAYELRAESERTKPYAETHDLSGTTGEHDFGEIAIGRWYFVSGRVTGEGENGVGGVSVSLIRPAGGDAGFSFLALAKSGAQAEPTLADTESAADGSYRLRLPDPGIFTVRAGAPGWATHYRNDLVVGGAIDTRADLALTRGEPVTGYVLDAAGRPLGGAVVALYAGGAFRLWTFSKEVDTTDGEGRFSFVVEPGGSEYSVSVEPGRGVSVSKRFNVPLNEDLVVRLPGTGVVLGRVVDADTRQPVPGADLMLGFVANAGQRMGMPDAGKAVVTDGHGAFRIEGVGTGVLQSIYVQTQGYAPFQGNAFMPSDRAAWEALSALKFTGEGEVMLPDIALKRGRSLVGTVTDATTHRPIPGARVELSDFVMGNRFAATDANGDYRFDGVADRVTMAVTSAGYAPLRDPPFPGTQLDAGSRRDFSLEPGSAVEGRVADAQGRPVERALVRLRPADRGWGGWNTAIALRDLWTHTDREGRYVLRGVPPVKLYAEAEAPGYDACKSEEKDVRGPGGVKGLDLVMLEAARFEGVVTALDGTPVGGARLTVARDPGENANAGDEWRALGEGKWAFTDAKGAFLVEAVPVGDVLVRIEADGFATRTERRKGVEAGARVTALRLELAPAYSIAGKVVDPDGRPVVNCWVRATHTAAIGGEPNRQLLGARVEPDGSFLLRNIAGGTYSIEVVVNNWMPDAARLQNLTRDNVAAGTRDLVLALVVAPPPPG